MFLNGRIGVVALELYQGYGNSIKLYDQSSSCQYCTALKDGFHWLGSIVDNRAPQDNKLDVRSNSGIKNVVVNVVRQVVGIHHTSPIKEQKSWNSLMVGI